MRYAQKKLLDLLGAPAGMGAYETAPWSAYDGEKGVTCSAEVRMDPSAEEVEAEIQMVYDIPTPPQKPLEQIMLMKAHYHAQDKLWTIDSLLIKGKPFQEVYNWEEKGCNFFRACAQKMLQGEVPDIDALMEEELHAKERGANQYGGGSSKAPKIKADALLDMNKRGF